MGTTPPKGEADYLALGDWNAACAVCGRKKKASTMRKLPAGIGSPWAGDQYVCPNHWRPRQPQDWVRGIPDKMAAPWVQPMVDLSVPMCTPQGISAIPGEAQPGCCTPGYLSPSYIDDYFTP